MLKRRIYQNTVNIVAVWNILSISNNCYVLNLNLMIIIYASVVQLQCVHDLWLSSVCNLHMTNITIKKKQYFRKNDALASELH